MKHIKYAWLCAALLLFLTACGGNNVSDAANDHLEITAPDAGDSTPEFDPVNASGEDAERFVTGEAANYYLEITTPTAGDTTLEFSIVNASGEDAEILLIPALEIRAEDGAWEVISFDGKTGFCGTKDPLPVGKKNWSVELDELWNNLYAGEYRLSYTVTDAEGREFTASGEFSLPYDIVQIARA